MKLEFLNKGTKNYYISNGILCVVGYVVNKSISFFMIPILTRMMSTGDYGKVNTYIAWLSILAYIMGLALEYSVRTAYVDHKDNFDRHISAICSLSLVNLFISGTVIFLINKFFVHQGNDLACTLCILHAYVYAVINYFNIKYTMLEQYLKRLALLLIPNLVSAVLSVVIIYLSDGQKYMGRIWGYILVFVPLGIFLILNQYKKVPCFYNKDYWIYGLKISTPMILHGLSTVVLSSSDRIIINAFRGDVETGIYSLVHNFIMVVVAIFNALENVWLPWFTKQMQKNEYEKINKMAVHYLQLVVVMVCGVLLISPEIIVIMGTSEYQSGSVLLIPLVCSSLLIFLYSLSVSTELYYKKTKNIAVNTICVAAFNIVFDCALVPKFGMVAAAYVTLVSYTLSFLGHYICARSLNNKLFPMKGYVLPILCVICISLLTTIFSDIWVFRWIFAFIIGVLYLFFAYFKFVKTKSVF